MEWSAVVSGVVGALLSGGGMGGIMTIYYRNRMERQQLVHGQSKDHQEFLNAQNREMIVALRQEVESYRIRLAKLEKAYDLLREEMAGEYAEDIKLQAEINRLRQERSPVKSTG